MAITRKQLWIATYAALFAAAMIIAIVGPRRSHTPAGELPTPAPQSGVSSGCDSGELPKALDAEPPQISDPSAPREETLVMKHARQKIIACVLHKLWPTASIQFKWEDDGSGMFDIVFPNNAYRRPSVLSMSQMSEDKSQVTFAAFVWLPREREIDMLPLVIARSDADGRVSYTKALGFDSVARISEENPPRWINVDESRFEFEYSAEYVDGSRSRITWDVILDVGSAEVVRRVPTRAVLSGTPFNIAAQRSDGNSIVLNVSTASGSRNIRVACERVSGADCVVDRQALLSELNQTR